MIALIPIAATEVPRLRTALRAYFAEMALDPPPDAAAIAAVAARQFGHNRLPYWLVSGGTDLGFALAFRHDDSLLELAEFMIHPTLRRAGRGRAAAKALFRRHPGRWQLGVFDSPAARGFWDATLTTLPGITELTRGPALTPAQSHAFRFTTRD